MNGFLLFGIISIAIIDIVVNLLMMWYTLEEQDYDVIPQLINPIHIYRNVRVNWFGCLCLTLVYHIIFAPIAIGYWIYKLGWLFYKLCTVGRK